jgi:hypothetical protein
MSEVQSVLNDLSNTFMKCCGTVANNFTSITPMGDMFFSCYAYLILGIIGIIIGIIMITTKPDKKQANPNVTKWTAINYIGIVIIILSIICTFYGIKIYMECSQQKSEWISKLAAIPAPETNRINQTGYDLYKRISNIKNEIAEQKHRDDELRHLRYDKLRQLRNDYKKDNVKLI